MYATFGLESGLRDTWKIVTKIHLSKHRHTSWYIETPHTMSKMKFWTDRPTDIQISKNYTVLVCITTPLTYSRHIIINFRFIRQYPVFLRFKIDTNFGHFCKSARSDWNVSFWRHELTYVNIHISILCVPWRLWAVRIFNYRWRGSSAR